MVAVFGIGVGHTMCQIAGINRVAACIHGQRQNGGGIACMGAIIGTPVLVFIAAPTAADHPARTGKHFVGAWLITIAGQGRADLGNGQWRSEIARFFISVVTQITHVCRPFTGQHEQGIGHVLASPVKVGGIVDAVAQVINGRAEGAVGHIKALGTRTT